MMNNYMKDSTSDHHNVRRASATPSVRGMLPKSVSPSEVNGEIIIDVAAASTVGSASLPSVAIVIPNGERSCQSGTAVLQDVENEDNNNFNKSCDSLNGFANGSSSSSPPTTNSHVKVITYSPVSVTDETVNLTVSAMASVEQPICRICHCSDQEEFFGDSSPTSVSSTTSTRSPSLASSSMSNVNTLNRHTTDLTLINPCYCSGSLRYVHHYCLQQWIRSSNNKHCELCKYHFKMSVKYRPFHKWERLEMSSGERKKLLCNFLFNLISMFCVFWSIYVLIERATLEAKYGLLDWPFWTKMMVVSIGFLGGTIFLFVQLRLYFSVFLRWRQFNRVIVIHNIADTEKRRNTLPIFLPLGVDLHMENK